jgi:phytoene synthase
VELLAPGSRACIRTAYHLYGGILDEIERADYDVFARRAVVPNHRRLTVTARCLVVKGAGP